MEENKSMNGLDTAATPQAGSLDGSEGGMQTGAAAVPEAFGPVYGTAGITAPAGAAGTAGITAPAGAVGTAGITAPAGAAGTAGMTAPAGAVGTAGMAAPAGAAGTAGITAPAGAVGTAGMAAPVGAAGTAGITAPVGAEAVNKPGFKKKIPAYLEIMVGIGLAVLGGWMFYNTRGTRLLYVEVEFGRMCKYYWAPLAGALVFFAIGFFTLKRLGREVKKDGKLE